MKVEVLYFDGCPNHEALLPRLRELLSSAGVSAAIELVRVEEADAAERERFLGSPTVRVDGKNVEPGADERSDFGLKCRLFATPDGLRGMPADEWVMAALRRHRDQAADGARAPVAPMAEPASQRSAGIAADALRGTFPGCEDAPLALALVRLLAAGLPVTAEMLSEATERTTAEVAAQLKRWPNVECDGEGAIVGFSGLTLRPTAHAFEVDGRALHTWCAWDTLFLPAMLGTTARVRSTCPVTRSEVELDVGPDGVEHAEPARLYVSFPPPAATDTADITGSFCCHVHFLAGDDAARTWQDAHSDGEVLDFEAAFALGCGAVAPLTAPGAGRECC